MSGSMGLLSNWLSIFATNLPLPDSMASVAKGQLGPTAQAIL